MDARSIVSLAADHVFQMMPIQEFLLKVLNQRIIYQQRIIIIINPMLSYQPNTANLSIQGVNNSLTQPPLQPQPLSLQQNLRSLPSPQNFTKENTIQLTNSYFQRPVSQPESLQIRQSAPQMQTKSLIISGSDFNQAGSNSIKGKYHNKYSFKRNSNRPKIASTYVSNSDANATLRQSQNATLRQSQNAFSQLSQCRAIIEKQEIALNKIRQFTFKNRSAIESQGLNIERIRSINALTQIHNLTLLDRSTFRPLEFIPEQIVPQNQSLNSNFNQQIIRNEAIKTLSSPQNIQLPLINLASTQNLMNVQSQRSQRQPQFAQPPFIQQQVVLAQPIAQSENHRESVGSFAKTGSIPVNPIRAENNNSPARLDNNFVIPNNQQAFMANNSELFTRQIRELRNKIEVLEDQNLSLAQKLRNSEDNNRYSSINTQSTIEIYREEINTLKVQIAQINELYNRENNSQDKEEEISYLKQSVSTLSDTVKQYEEQLIQAQNHIIYLQNSRNGENNEELQAEIEQLRNTIAKYTQHIEQVDIQKNKFEEILQQREEWNMELAQQINANKVYIGTLEEKLNLQKHDNLQIEAKDQEFNYLVSKYEANELQINKLIDENKQLTIKYQQNFANLEKAEECITQLQQSLQNSNQAFEQEVKVTHVVNEPNPLPIHEDYEQLLEAIKSRDQQAAAYQEEIKKLNSQYIETREHLQKAEDHIIQLQTASQAVPVVDNEAIKLLELQNNQLLSKLNLFEQEYLKQKAERESLQIRETNFSAEYEDMELRYKSALDSLGTRYDELLQERNIMVSKLSVNETYISDANNGAQEEIENLKVSFNNLNLQLQESRNHLRTAEEYIESNVKSWQEASCLKDQHAQQLSFIAAINSDLESTRVQNLQLAERISSFQKLVSEAQDLKSENQKLTIFIRQKDNSSLSSSLKQIDEVQEALNNYTHLYNQSELTGKWLKEENQHLKGELTKISQLQELLVRAENYIVEQEEKYNEDNKQLKQHLFNAEKYIMSLQQENEQLKHNT